MVKMGSFIHEHWAFNQKKGLIAITIGFVGVDKFTLFFTLRALA